MACFLIVLGLVIVVIGLLWPYEAAELFFEVVSVQNLYNIVDRSSEEVLDHCEADAIGFIPWYPLASGNLVRSGSILDNMASKYRAAPSQIALAWLLRRSPAIIPIPGTAKVAHLEENVAACVVRLSDRDFDLLDREGWKAWRAPLCWRGRHLRSS
jgi:pyridoxine 4-dehydrogenase